MRQSPYDWLESSLDAIHRANWHRSVKPLLGKAGPVIEREGQTLLNFGSNDYLGLAGDERLAQAAIAAIQTYGTGSTGSRLMTGHRMLHDQLEHAIAHLKQTEAAIVFSSGYLANLGTVSALVGKRDLILADQYNHSSLKQGAILSGATVIEYRHCDLANLQQQLSNQRANFRRCLIVTDSVFSMDGDLCPLPPLLDLAETYQAMVLVDEAHATGVFGQTGAGCVEHWGCTGRPLVQVGTLSKALGSLGGYVAGSATLIDFLRNRAPGWIYTTGLAPADTAAALAAVQVIQQEPQRRDRLWQIVDALRQNLQSSYPTLPEGFQWLPSQSPILCFQVDRPATALHLSQTLQSLGVFIPAVRPPTVPTSRLRITLMATHTPAQVEQLANALKKVMKCYRQQGI